jgi:hypothetical protein
MSDQKSPPEPDSSPSRLVRWLRLGTGLFLLYLLYLVTPAFFEAFTPLRNFNQIVQETDIRPGAMFYNDVPQSIEAQMSNRDAIRYFVRQQRNNPERPAGKK